MAEPRSEQDRYLVDSVRLLGLARVGSPSILQPGPDGAWLQDAVNVEGSSLGRIRPRPAARDLHEPGAAQTSLWPRMLPSGS